MYLLVIMRAWTMKVMSSIQGNIDLHSRAPEALIRVCWEDARTSVIQCP